MKTAIAKSHRLIFLFHFVDNAKQDFAYIKPDEYDDILAPLIVKRDVYICTADEAMHKEFPNTVYTAPKVAQETAA